MLHNEYLDERRLELIATVRQILNGEAGLIAARSFSTESADRGPLRRKVERLETETRHSSGIV